MEFSAAIFRVKNAKSNVWRIDDKKRIRRGGGGAPKEQAHLLSVVWWSALRYYALAPEVPRSRSTLRVKTKSLRRRKHSGKVGWGVGWAGGGEKKNLKWIFSWDICISRFSLLFRIQGMPRDIPKYCNLK